MLRCDHPLDGAVLATAIRANPESILGSEVGGRWGMAREPGLSYATSFASAGCAPRPLSGMPRLPRGLGAG